jgi:hypothetical protein
MWTGAYVCCACVVDIPMAREDASRPIENKPAINRLRLDGQFAIARFDFIFFSFFFLMFGLGFHISLGQKKRLICSRYAPIAI